MFFGPCVFNLLQSTGVRGIVIAERTPMSDQYFAALQKFTVLELGLVLMPVTNQSEAAGLLTQIVGPSSSFEFFSIKHQCVKWQANILQFFLL